MIYGMKVYTPGGVYFDGVNDVTFQRDEFTMNWTNSSSGIDIVNQQDAYNITYADDWFNGTAAGPNNPCPPDAILSGYGGSQTIRRSFFNGMIRDMFAESNSVYVNNYAPDIIAACGSHNENIFVGDQANVQIRHNNLGNSNPQTSTIFSDTYFGPSSNITIDDNLLYGGGYCLYASGLSLNETYSNNYLATTYFPYCGYFTYEDNGVVYAIVVRTGVFNPGINYSNGNVWTDNMWNKTDIAINP
jgi:hypothetical protein